MLNRANFSHFRNLNPVLIGFVLLGICLSTSQSINGQGQPAPTTRRYEFRANSLPNSTTLRGAITVSYAATSPSIAIDPLADATPIEKRAFELTNSVRIDNGRTPLTWDQELCRLARAYSEKMARLGFFAHVEPDGSDLRDRARTAGIHYRAIGENIAYNRGFDDPGASTVQRWMDSSAHRSNLLGREYRASAVGVFVSLEGRVYITQLFITR